MWPQWWSSAIEIHVTLLQDEDGVWVVECPAIPGCASQGETKEEALEELESIRAFDAAKAAADEAIPAEQAFSEIEKTNP
jgi:predicted RNase H-like HicB family nuclease